MTISQNIYQKRQNAVMRTCAYCQKTMRVWASTLRFGRAKYCSRACFKLSRRVEVACANCGKQFVKTYAFTRRYKGKRDFCSKSCSGIFRRKPEKIPIKRARYGNTMFLKARLKVIERDGICQICSVDNARSIHHKNWRPHDNRLENLVLLCKKCHGRFRREENWEDGKLRIMAYSELHSNMQSTAEMPVPAINN